MTHLLKFSTPTRPLILLLLLGLILPVLAPTPSSAQSTPPKKIESDAAQVTQAGTWLSQTDPTASGGAYLSNSGDEAALSLSFSGPSLEVIYVTGPTLGTLAIEIDGSVLRTVITTSDTTQFSQRATINYLADAPHVLRVYAQAGDTVAIDAFVVAELSDPAAETSEGQGIAESSTTGAEPRVDCVNYGSTFIASIVTGGAQANSSSVRSSLSADGRYVAFDSFAINLFTGDTNISEDVFVYDRQTCTTTHVSVSSAGVAANSTARYPSISGDGRYIAFESSATNLVAADTNGRSDVFVHDRQTNTTTRVSVGAGGAGNGNSYNAAISADGRYVAFSSDSTNLVVGDTNEAADVFVYDQQTTTTTLISLNSSSAQGNGHSILPAISADGRYVAFWSYSTNLVAAVPITGSNARVYLRDRQTAETTSPALSSTGVYDDSGANVGLHDNPPAISADGRYVAFSSLGTNLVTGDANGFRDIFVRDRQTNTTTIASASSAGVIGNIESFSPAISADGRYIAFHSLSNNLVAGDSNNATDIFLHDRQTAQTQRVSVSIFGSQPISVQEYPAISADGRYISFSSASPNLTLDDFNGRNDIFVRDMQGVFAPSGLAATATSSQQITLNWHDNASDETQFRIERSPNGLNGWVELDTTAANVTTYPNINLICGATYYYRVRAYRAAGNLFSGFSNIVFMTTINCANDSLALFRPDLNAVSLLNTVQDLPPLTSYNSYTANAPAIGSGQWVMGDWDGDGQKTPGVYGGASGAFYYTNAIGPNATWASVWIGFQYRPPVSGRFNAAVNHDCIGVVDNANFPPYGIAFALYFTCDLTPNTAPPLTFQWLSVLLPDSGGFRGPFQFTAGDWNGDGVDSMALRRAEYISFTNVPPTTLESAFNLAQYWGIAPLKGDSSGILVSGDWDANGTDSFGVYYANAHFYRRHDLDWNSGVHILQRVGFPIGMYPVTAGSW